MPDGSREKNDFYFPEISVINPDRKYSNVVVLLEKCVSSTEINQRLRKQLPVFGKNNDNYLAVMTFKEEMYKSIKPKNHFTDNTTIGAIISNAKFCKAMLCKVASMGQNGLA